jgi:uncharacterized protein (DUF488 family)
MLTVGHGRLDEASLRELLVGAEVETVVDVRRFPGSRINPRATREALMEWLPAAGIGYSWDARLGGRRRLAKGEPVVDSWWTVPAFQAYAAHTRTGDFLAAMRDLLVEAASRRVAVMCSESVWWRCHRRLIADVMVLAHNRPVQHLMHAGGLVTHQVAAGARLGDDGAVVWDGQGPRGRLRA